MSGIMGGVKAGVIMGLIAGILGGIIQVVDAIPVLNLLVCLALPFTFGCLYFLFPIITGALSVMFAKSEIRSVADGAIAGIVGGVFYAIISWIIGVIVGVVIFILAQLLGFAAGWGDLSTAVKEFLVENVLFSIIGLVITLAAGIFWSVLAGAVYTLLAIKPSA